MRIRYQEGLPDGGKGCAISFYGALSAKATAEMRGEFCLVLRELDQNFYYWSVTWEELGRSSKPHELKTLKSPERKSLGLQAGRELIFIFKIKLVKCSLGVQAA